MLTNVGLNGGFDCVDAKWGQVRVEMHFLALAHGEGLARWLWQRHSQILGLYNHYTACCHRTNHLIMEVRHFCLQVNIYWMCVIEHFNKTVFQMLYMVSGKLHVSTMWWNSLLCVLAVRCDILSETIRTVSLIAPDLSEVINPRKAKHGGCSEFSTMPHYKMLHFHIIAWSLCDKYFKPRWEGNSRKNVY